MGLVLRLTLPAAPETERRAPAQTVFPLFRVLEKAHLIKSWAAYGLVVFCTGLFLLHGYIVMKHAVDVPYWDDWAFFGGDNHPASFDLKWLRAQHNEHR